LSFYINLHTHRKPQIDGEIAIRNAYLKPVQFSNISYPITLGLHPWFVQKADLAESLAIISTYHQHIIAIGECGIDRAINTPISLQLLAFTAQVELAQRYNLPVIVHCVKAYSDFAAIAKKFKQVNFVLHGFSGSDKILEMLLPFDNVYFSVGKHLFNPLSNASLTIKNIPLKHLFLETDTTSLLISTIYTQAAQILEIDEIVLKKQIFHNFALLFKNKNLYK
jgi:TatD DNase family protein